MAKVRFQATAASGLALLMLLPGVTAGLIEAPALDPPLDGGLPGGFRGALPEALAPFMGAVADQAFVGSFAQLQGLPGGELASLQPTLESLLRFYAQDRGFVLSPPRTPEPPETDALAPALLALGAAFGQPVPPEQLARARALPPELQQALARVVLAYLQATRAYTEAIAGLTRGDLEAMARGEPSSFQPDGGKIASAALLIDRAVRESTPALRKWALLLAIEERTQRPQLRDVGLDGLLRAGAATQSLRDAVDMASVLQGWQPVEAAFTPTSQHPREAMARFYRALGLPVLPDVDAGFQLLDRQGPAHQALVITLADGLRQALGPMQAAEALVSPEELAQAYADLDRLDLEALKALDPSAVDQPRLERILQVLTRADQAVQRRLQAAGILADALGLAADLAPHVAAEELLGPNPAPPGGYQTTDAGPVPTDAIEVTVPSVGVCRIGDGERGPAISCAGATQQLPNLKCVPASCQPEDNSYTLTLYLDENNDTRAGEDEVILRTPPLADKSNDIVFRDPYGFILVGGENRTFYDTRYGNVNVSLRVENGTIKEERRVLYNSPAADTVQTLFDLGDAVLPSRDTNATLFEPQYNGFVNLTFNPYNHTLAIVDLGGPDLYTNRAGGAQDELRLYNSTFSERVNRTAGTCPLHLNGTIVVVVGQCNNPPSGKPPVGGNQVIVDFGDLSTLDSGTPQFLFLNATNLSLPVRLGVVLDTSGDDQYNQEWNYTLGASDRGLGILWDLERCKADDPGPNCARLSQGNDVYVAPDNSTGAGTNRGVGILLDEAGDDTYQARNYSLGSGSGRGIGLAVDLAGNDRWHGENYTMGFGGRELFAKCGLMATPTPPPQPPLTQNQINTRTCPRGPFYAEAQGAGAPLNAAERASARAGLGVLLERRGNDHYGQANATSSQGKGWPALGLLLDLSGRDQGLQTNLTASSSDFGTLSVGYQENTLLTPPSQEGGGGPLTNDYYRFLHNGQGGGLVVDAEVTDTSALQDRATAAPGSGVGMGAVEVEGRANTFRCNSNADNSATVFNLVFSGTASNNKPPNRRCVPFPGEPQGSPNNWQLLSGQEFLIRIPGLFGLGGVGSNAGLGEAPIHAEEHLLQIDLAGNDRYRGPFAGAQTPNMSALDTEGHVKKDAAPAAQDPGYADQDPNMAPLYQAGLLAPVALTLDLQGADTYDARTQQLGHNSTTGRAVTRNATTPTLGGAYAGMGFLYDMGLSTGSSSSTRFGVPPACARGGLDDIYVGYNRTLGYGAMFGVGVVFDQDGDDCYVALAGDGGANVSAPSLGMGMGQLGGIGALLDARGNDTYSAGNLSQGAAILEQVNRNLPRRVTGSTISFHDALPNSQNNLEPGTANVQNAFGAFYDGRGDDGYAFGNASQGWGELHPRSVSDVNGLGGQAAMGPRKVLGGLFVDDGFGLDRYANHSRVSINLSSLAGHKDNSFWCANPRVEDFGPLNATLGSALGANGPEAAQALADVGARIAANLTMLGALVQQNLSRLGAQADAGHGESANATLRAAAALVAQNLTQLGQQMRDLLRAQAEVANATLAERGFPDAGNETTALVGGVADTVAQTLRDAGRQAGDAVAAQGSAAGPALGEQGRALNRTLAAEGAAAEQRLRDLGDSVRGGTGGGSGVAVVDQARETAAFGPNRDATCVRIELDATAKSVDLGSLGRGFDNLDFFANFLLAMGTFGQDYIKLRSVLNAPVVEPVRCFTSNDTTPRPNCQLDGTVVLTTNITWGLKALVYNAGQVLVYHCGKLNPGPACTDLLSGPVNLTTSGAAGVLTNSPTLNPPQRRDEMRRVEFAAREPGTDREVPLGVMDRRKGIGCRLTLEGGGRNFSIPDGCGNVTFPNGDTELKRTMLKWDTRALLDASDGLPELRTPDGTWEVVVRAYFQPDNVSGPEAGTQREVLRRLGDEYSANNNQTELPFYPGFSVTRVVVDNPPVVYQLEYKDVSLATHECQPEETPEQCAADQPYHTLGLDLTVSPRFNTTQPGYADQGVPEYRYNITAELLPVDALRGLEAVTFSCSAPGDQGPLFLPLACDEPPANRSQQPGGRARILGGWSEQSVFGSLSDGAYALRVTVTEPAHVVRDSVEPARVIALPERVAVRCFVFHGGPLVENITAQGACEGELFVDSVAPQVTAALDPSRAGADGATYVNRTVAYPEGRSIANGDDAILPLRFDTLNAAQKRSRVMEFNVSALVLLASPDPTDVRYNVTGGLFSAPRGNLTLRVCADVENNLTAACLERNDTRPAEAVDYNRSFDVYSVEVAAGARDLAGNRDPLVTRVVEIPIPGNPDPRLVRAPEPEASGFLDVDGPVAALCQPVTNLKPMPPELPRVRTRERLLPMPWRPVLTAAGDDACVGAIQPSDNRGVEAVLIVYNVTDPGAQQAPADLTRVWQPPGHQQATRLALFDFDTRDAADLVNNRTLHYAARALDLAGNLQQLDRDLLTRRTIYDVRPPSMEALNITPTHHSIAVKWFARDLEANGKVVRSYLRWGAIGDSGEDNLTQLANATQIGNLAFVDLDALDSGATYSLQAFSLDDVGNLASLPVVHVATDPIIRLEIASPRPGDILHGAVPLVVRVSDLRGEPELNYTISFVAVSPTENATLVVPVESFARRECVPGEQDCPNSTSVVTFVRTLQTARLPDTREGFLRIAVTRAASPGKPLVASVGPLLVDNTPPVTTLTVVAHGGPEWFRSAALLTLQPRDNITQVVSTEYSFDNFTFLAYNASAPPVQDREGSLPFFWRSVDQAGNVEPLQARTINVDRQRPVGELRINDGGAATSEPEVDVFLRASDALSGIANATLDAGGRLQALDHPERFAAGRHLRVELPSGEGEQRVRVRLTDRAGNVQELKASIVIDTLPPQVTDVRVEQVGHTSATLSWRTSEDAVTRVEYGPASASALANRFQADERTRVHLVTLQGLRPSLAYQFRVVALDALGNRATQRGTFETLPDVTPPGAPRGLRAEDLRNGAVRLDWQAAFDDVGIDHYIVFRGVAGQLEELGRVAELLSIDDQGMPGVRYDYAVLAVDLAGHQGPRSGIASARATTRPLLIDPRVTPDRGTATQLYTYSVVVRDADGDAPLDVRVRLGNSTFALRPQFEGRADFARGVLYSVSLRLPTTTLSSGFPTYQFEVDDGQGVVVGPDLPATGPAVLGASAIIPGLSAASSLLGLPGFEVLLAALAAGAALLVLRRRRGA